MPIATRGVIIFLVCMCSVVLRVHVCCISWNDWPGSWECVRAHAIAL